MEPITRRQFYQALGLVYLWLAVLAGGMADPGRPIPRLILAGGLLLVSVTQVILSRQKA